MDTTHLAASLVASKVHDSTPPLLLVSDRYLTLLEAELMVKHAAAPPAEVVAAKYHCCVEAPVQVAVLADPEVDVSHLLMSGLIMP